MRGPATQLLACLAALAVVTGLLSGCGVSCAADRGAGATSGSASGPSPGGVGSDSAGGTETTGIVLGSVVASDSSSNENTTASPGEPATLNPQPTHLRPGSTVTGTAGPGPTTTTLPPPAPATPLPPEQTTTSLKLVPITGETIPTTWTLYQEDDPLIGWTGNWLNLMSPFGNTYRQCTPPIPSAFRISFYGTSIVAVSMAGPDQGIARVTVDNKPPITVDLYTPSVDTHAFASSALPLGYHTVLFEWTGTKNAASSGTAINLDAIELVGRLVKN